MGNFANTLFSSLLGWLRSAAAWLWSFISDPESGGLMIWIAENWLVLVILLCAACMLIDFIVYLFRWQPYKVWASFFRRMFGRGEDDAEDTGRIRRRWVHADGTTSVEVIDAAEVAAEPEQPQVFAAQPDPEALTDRYARFARPEEDPDFQQEEPETMERPTRPAPRRRFAANEEELPLRYAPPPANEDAASFHEPYYPPQWKRPADTGASGVDVGGSGA